MNGKVAMFSQLLFAITTLCFIVAAPPIVSATEWYTDTFIGTATTQDAEIESHVGMYKETCVGWGCMFFSGPGMYGFSRTTENAKFDRSFTFGGRVGYWKENQPWTGFALDVSFFTANAQETEYKIHYPLNRIGYGDIKSLKIRAIPVTLQGIFRLPLLKTDKYKNGRLQSYAGIGLGFFFIDLDIDLRPEVSNIVSTNEYSAGTVLLVGLKWQILEQTSILLEYRVAQTRLDIEFDYEGSQQKELTDFEMKLKTQFTLVGISYSF